MTRDRRLNDEADDLATRCRQYMEEDLMSHQPKLFLPDSIIGLRINNALITKDFKKEIRKAMHDDRMKIFLCKKYGWTEEVFNSIDWEPIESNLFK